MMLVGDIGGTNSRLAFCDDKFKLYNVITFPTDKDFFSRIVIFSQQRRFSKVILGVAGPVSSGKTRLTNNMLCIDEKKLSSLLKVPVLLINDLEALGYGTLLPDGDYKSVRKGKRKNEVSIVISVGTGLGKCIVVGSKVIASEGSHMDFPEKISTLKGKLQYEDVISGHGSEKMYFAFAGKRIAAEDIRKQKNAASRKTFSLMSEGLAVFARNSAIDVFALGGIYFAGGVCTHNPELFSAKFIKTFSQHPIYSGVLKEIPLYLITDTTLALRGAAKRGKDEIISRFRKPRRN